MLQKEKEETSHALAATKMSPIRSYPFAAVIMYAVIAPYSYIKRFKILANAVTRVITYAK
jgi:hypothetical protein